MYYFYYIIHVLVSLVLSITIFLNRNMTQIYVTIEYRYICSIFINLYIYKFKIIYDLYSKEVI